MLALGSFNKREKTVYPLMRHEKCSLCDCYHCHGASLRLPWWRNERYPTIGFLSCVLSRMEDCLLLRSYVVERLALLSILASVFLKLLV